MALVDLLKTAFETVKTPTKSAVSANSLAKISSLPLGEPKSAVDHGGENSGKKVTAPSLFSLLVAKNIAKIEEKPISPRDPNPPKQNEQKLDKTPTPIYIKESVNNNAIKIETKNIIEIKSITAKNAEFENIEIEEIAKLDIEQINSDPEPIILRGAAIETVKKLSEFVVKPPIKTTYFAEFGETKMIASQIVERSRASLAMAIASEIKEIKEIAKENNLLKLIGKAVERGLDIKSIKVENEAPITAQKAVENKSAFSPAPQKIEIAAKEIAGDLPVITGLTRNPPQLRSGAELLLRNLVKGEIAASAAMTTLAEKPIENKSAFSPAPQKIEITAKEIAGQNDKKTNEKIVEQKRSPLFDAMRSVDQSIQKAQKATEKVVEKTAAKIVEQTKTSEIIKKEEIKVPEKNIEVKSAPLRTPQKIEITAKEIADQVRNDGNGARNDAEKPIENKSAPSPAPQKIEITAKEIAGDLPVITGLTRNLIKSEEHEIAASAAMTTLAEKPQEKARTIEAIRESLKEIKAEIPSLSALIKTAKNPTEKPTAIAQNIMQNRAAAQSETIKEIAPIAAQKIINEYEQKTQNIVSRFLSKQTANIDTKEPKYQHNIQNQQSHQISQPDLFTNENIAQNFARFDPAIGLKENFLEKLGGTAEFAKKEPLNITSEEKQEIAASQTEQTEQKTEVKIIAARQSARYFAAQLNEAAQNYRPPITKITIAMQPAHLGSVEVTIIKRGENLIVSAKSAAQTIALLSAHTAEFRQSLTQIGFNEVQIFYVEENKNSGGDRRGSREKSRFQEGAIDDEVTDNGIDFAYKINEARESGAGRAF